MRFTRWTNHSLPQTLQIAVFLFYIDAVFGLLYGAAYSLIGFAVLAGGVLSGLGIANEHRWGYRLGLVIAALGLVPFALIAAQDGLGDLLTFRVLLSLVFPVALFVALVHPLSRSHQRIWFH